MPERVPHARPTPTSLSGPVAAVSQGQMSSVGTGAPRGLTAPCELGKAA
jgi:hypothetical protein